MIDFHSWFVLSGALKSVAESNTEHDTTGAQRSYQLREFHLCGGDVQFPWDQFLINDVRPSKLPWNCAQDLRVLPQVQLNKALLRFWHVPFCNFSFQCQFHSFYLKFLFMFLFVHMHAYMRLKAMNVARGDRINACGKSKRSWIYAFLPSPTRCKSTPSPRRRQFEVYSHNCHILQPSQWVVCRRCSGGLLQKKAVKACKNNFMESCLTRASQQTQKIMGTCQELLLNGPVEPVPGCSSFTEVERIFNAGISTLCSESLDDVLP